MNREDAIASDAHSALLELFYGRWRSQTMHAGVALGIFDAVGEARVTADATAAALALDPGCTYRLMRALAALGLLYEDPGRTFKLTDAGAMLRSDHPRSMRAAVLLREGVEHTAVWQYLPDIVRDGKQNGFERAFGMPAFEYAACQASYGAAFEAGMSSQSSQQSAWTLEALEGCGLESLGHLCDIGGGQGHLLCHLLARYPALRGTILERPQTRLANPSWASVLGVEERCVWQAGDMFEDVPAADGYIMKMILHDWSDEECVHILRNARRRVVPPGRLFVVEHVVPAGGRPDYAALFDMHMMCWGTGRERTEEEYAGLLRMAGWRPLTTRYPGSRVIGVVEGVAA